MAEIKISDLTPKGANLIATDLLVVSEDIGGGLYHANNSVESNLGGFSDWGNSSGLFLSNRIVGTEMSVFRNTTKQLDNTTSAALATLRSDFSVPIGCQSTAADARRFYNAYSNSFASIGDGLTDTEAANYYTAVQTFQTTLNRQVV